MRVVLLFTSIFLINLNLSFGQVSVQEIYNFDVGDIFQYKEENGYSSASGYTQIIIKKYTITSKEISGDTIRFNFEGIQQSISGSFGIDMETSLIKPEVSAFSSNQTIVDSADHYINMDDGDTITISSYFMGDAMEAIVSVENDSIKRFTTDYSHSEIYAKGLGLVYWSEAYGRMYRHRELISYVINKDTTGVLISDDLILPCVDSSKVCTGCEVSDIESGYCGCDGKAYKNRDELLAAGVKYGEYVGRVEMWSSGDDSCAGSNRTIGVQPADYDSIYYSYLWNTGQAFPTEIVWPQETTIFTVELTTLKYGCIYTDSITLEVSNPIGVIDTVVIFGDSVLLGDIYYSSPGEYTQTRHAPNGCDSIIEISIQLAYSDTCRFVVHDTVIVYDTIRLYDTVIVYDTIRLYDIVRVVDSIVVLDTVSVYDTIAIYDTTMVLDTVYFSIWDTTGLSNSMLEENSGVVVYPNPVENVINIKNNYGDIESVTVLNELGEVVLKETFNKANVSISVNFLTSGVYIVNVRTGEHDFLVKKLLVTR